MLWSAYALPDCGHLAPGGEEGLLLERKFHPKWVGDVIKTTRYSKGIPKSTSLDPNQGRMKGRLAGTPVRPAVSLARAGLNTPQAVLEGPSFYPSSPWDRE